MTDDCAYRLTLGIVDDEFDADPCGRPTWDDHDRCVWHAPVAGKNREDAGTAFDGQYQGAHLPEAELVGVDWFADASLVGADLQGADIRGAAFTDADLTLVVLRDTNAMSADFTGANLEGAILSNADVRRAIFTDARLHETVLTDLHIGAGTAFDEVSVYDSEGITPDLVDEAPLEADAWVSRQLQHLYQQNGLISSARLSYYRRQDAARRFAWTQGNYFSAFRRELSRWVMRYGESPYRVVAASLVVIAAFAVLFPLTGGIQESQGESTLTYSLDDPEDAPQWWLIRVLLKSLYFSVVTFATLGYGDIQPIGSWARFLAGTEALLGALLAALLVFVLVRLMTW